MIWSLHPTKLLMFLINPITITHHTNLHKIIVYSQIKTSKPQVNSYLVYRGKQIIRIHYIRKLVVISNQNYYYFARKLFSKTCFAKSTPYNHSSSERQIYMCICNLITMFCHHTWIFWVLCQYDNLKSVTSILQECCQCDSIVGPHYQLCIVITDGLHMMLASLQWTPYATNSS